MPRFPQSDWRNSRDAYYDVTCQVLKPYSCIWKCMRGCSQHAWQADTGLHKVCAGCTWANEVWSGAVILLLPGVESTWLRLAAFHQLTRPIEVTAEMIYLPSSALESESNGITHLSLCKKSSALPATSMRAGKERPKRPKAPLPASILGKATDFLAFKLFKGFETFVCELLEFQGSQGTSTCLMDAKSKCTYNPRVKRNWFGGNSELHSQKENTSTWMGVTCTTWYSADQSSQWSPKGYSFIALNLNPLSRNSR